MSPRAGKGAEPKAIRPFAPPEPVEKARSLSAEEWTDAALLTMREGIDAVAVESLARRLGVTKGSFYWHFRDRGALIEAALERWEELATSAVIQELSALGDARERLRQLFATAMLGDETHLAIEIAVTAAADDPLVAPIVARVSQRRLDYLVGLYLDMGFKKSVAQSRGLLAYAAYVGILCVLRTNPQVLPDQRKRQAYVRQLLESLLP